MRLLANDNVFKQSFSGTAFEIKVVERGRITDKMIIRNQNELRFFMQKYDV